MYKRILLSTTCFGLLVAFTSPAEALNQCSTGKTSGQQFDCGKDPTKGDPSRVDRPDPPTPGDDDDDDDDDDDTGDDDDDDDDDDDHCPRY